MGAQGIRRPFGGGAGDDVEIGEDSSVWPLTVVRGDMHRIRIGARTSVQDGSVLHITHAGPLNPDGFALIIGDEVTIGHKVMPHGLHVATAFWSAWAARSWTVRSWRMK